MKKWISLIMITVILAVGLTACEKKSEKPKEPGNPPANTAEEVEKPNNESEEGEGIEGAVKDEALEGEISGEAVGGTLLIYSGNEDATGFKQQEVELPEITPEAVLAELSKQGVLLSDITILAFSQADDDGKKVINLDLSAAFTTFLKTQGTSGEYITIGSICNTYLEAYGCERIRLTVEGETLVTGHAEYPGYMSAFK